MSLNSFPPVIDRHTRILIIGSMPGTVSLAAQEYYAYKYNQFWRLIFDALEQGRTPKNYTDKLNTLLSNGIGLWDTLAHCERKGSSDAAIAQPYPNDFPALFKQFPQIHTLLFNGRTAAAYFKRAFGSFLEKNIQVLPSTSPAHASLCYSDKYTIWHRALTQALALEQRSI